MMLGPFMDEVPIGEDSSGSLYLTADINGVQVSVLLDSGATVSVIHPSVLSKVLLRGDVPLEGRPGQIRIADGSVLDTQGSAKLGLKFPDSDRILEQDFMVAAVDVAVVLGLDFFKQHHCTVDFGKNVLTVGGRVHRCSMLRNMPKVFRITMADTVVVPPLCEMIIPGKVEGNPHFTQAFVESRDYPLCHGNIAMAKMLINPTRSGVPLRVANISSEPQVLYKGMKVAQCEEMESAGLPLFTHTKDEGTCADPKGEVHPTKDVPDHIAGMMKGAGSMSEEQYQVATDMLSNFQSDFITSKEDLTSTDVLQHSMTMTSPKPVKLPPHRVPPATAKGGATANAQGWCY